jgi:glycosyltransferase involved in cell wall biosynthesis
MDQRKRALVVVHSFFLRDSRAFRHAEALVERGWEVDVVCARDEGEPASEVSGPIRIRRMPGRRRGGSARRKVFEYAMFGLSALIAVTSWWIRRRHRLVYVLGIPNFIVFSAVVPRLFGVRVLLDMRDPFPEFYLSKYGADERGGAPRWLMAEERLSARFASRVLAVHPPLAELYTRSVPSDRITVIWNAPNTRLFAETTRSSRDPDDRTLLYTGTVTYPYGVDLAIEAVARLRDEIPRLRLRIVGHGELMETLPELARAEGIADRVTFEPFVPFDQVADIVGKSWVGVQPNRDVPVMEMSLSTKILEWCHQGLPVVVGRTPPLEELFPNDELLFHDRGDLDGMCERIREAHADPDGLARRAKGAQEAVRKLRYDDQIETFVRIAETSA